LLFLTRSRLTVVRDQHKVSSVIFAQTCRLVSRILVLIPALMLLHPVLLRAEPITIHFTAKIGANNSIDLGDIFNEGAGADLKGQVIAGAVTIDPAPLTDLCGTAPACYADFGAGAVSVSFRLNGVTSTVVSTGTSGFFGGRSGGSIAISDRSHGGYNYLAAGAASEDGMVQQYIGALFGNATLFDADSDPLAAIASLGRIGGGSSLVKGGITLLTPVEHLDATILSIDVPEPATLSLLGLGALAMAAARRGRTSKA
jgi:hypothetical protein